MNNLKKLRESKGYTIAEISTLIGIGSSAYSNYESGLRELPLTVAFELSELHELPISYFTDIKKIDINKLKKEIISRLSLLNELEQSDELIDIIKIFK